MSSEACSMEHLVEAKHDGRLGARENASLDRHLTACVSCRALERTLSEVRDHLRAPTGPRVTPLEHQRGRLALLRAAAAPPSSHRSLLKPRRAALLASVGAACVVVLGLAVSLRAHPGVPVPLAQRLPTVPFHWPERTETTILGSAAARFERHAEGPLERVDLADGTLDLSVRKLAPGERFIVATADAEVEVRGTVFEVEAHDGKLASVSVSEGKVEVRHHGARALVTPGDTWRPPAPAPALSPTPAPSSAATVRRPAGPIAAGGPDAAAAPLSPASPEGGASRDFAAAVAKLASGNYGEASEKLAAFRKANPGDARAEDAAFLAIVSLQRAGKYTEAKEAARRYLAAYPGGDRRAEALAAAR